MKQNNSQSKKNKQRGFSLIELTFVLFIMSVLAVFTTKIFIAKTTIDKIDNDAKITSETVKQIQDAVGGYLVDQNEWADFSNSCSNAINILTTTTPTAYLRFMSSTTPYLTNYITSCDTNTFTIKITTNDDDNALVLANKIANATATASVVTTSIPRPVNQPTLTQFLLLDGTRAMTGDLDMGGNAITNTTHIATTDDRTVVKVETIAPMPIAIVTKPTCPTGLTATINLATTGIVLTSAKIPFDSPPFIETQTTTNWTIRLNVFDEDGVATAASGTFVQAISSCN